jgi:Tol biopolymer transport system component
VIRNLDLYFQVRNEGKTNSFIYYAKFEDGYYKKPEKLGKTINTGARELAPYVSPDGSYIIFTRMTRTENTDLFISFRDSTGYWKEAINMGESINSPSTELCPNVTPDSKYLFFLSTRDGESLAYWVDAKIIEKLKPKNL